MFEKLLYEHFNMHKHAAYYSCADIEDRFNGKLCNFVYLKVSTKGRRGW